MFTLRRAGYPLGFMTIAVISYLTSKGVDEAEAGKLAAVVLIPWTFKLIWAPLIDSVTIRSMGRRRAWIIGAELMMAATLLGFLATGDLTHELELLGWMFFVHNCFASLQDVCTDALAVDVLPPSEQGTANGLMWSSKLAGKGFGASVMAWVMAEWGIREAILLQVGLLLCIMAFPIFVLERPGEKRFPWSSGQAQDTDSSSGLRSPVNVLRDLFTAFSFQTTLLFALFATIKHIGSGVNEIVTKTLYTDPNGSLQWNAVEFSKVAGWYAIGPQLLGALLAAVLTKRFGGRMVISIGFGGFGLLAMFFAAFPGMWAREWFATSYLLLSEGLLAMASVGFLSFSMRISWTKAAATMFTVYMTLSNVGHAVGNWLAGPIRKQLSYEHTFWLIALAALLPTALLLLVDSASVDRFKYKNSSNPGNAQ